MPGIPYGKTLMTPPKNLALGFGRDFTNYRFLNARKRNLEYTITAKVDSNYAVSDAIAYTA